MPSTIQGGASPEFEAVLRNNAVVRNILQAGGSPEDCIVALDKLATDLSKENMRLSLIVPTRTRVGDKIFTYHCPDHLIPIDEPPAFASEM